MNESVKYIIFLPDVIESFILNCQYCNKNEPEKYCLENYLRLNVFSNLVLMITNSN